MSFEPVAYTYEAGLHCPSCAEARFGRGEHDEIANGAVDAEQNPVNAVCLGQWETDPAIVREGASLRTGDELNALFVLDVIALAQDRHKTDALPQAWEAERAFADLVSGWLENEDLQDYLEDLCREYEQALTKLGYRVDWNDGYVIDIPPHCGTCGEEIEGL